MAVRDSFPLLFLKSEHRIFPSSLMKVEINSSFTLALYETCKFFEKKKTEFALIRHEFHLKKSSSQHWCFHFSSPFSFPFVFLDPSYAINKVVPLKRKNLGQIVQNLLLIIVPKSVLFSCFKFLDSFHIIL
ncbi:hypothetical protein CW304_31100 [Bacillus sp. UFRGS-B20]|nr:hypothetical protein CW304_31100 [Bacillus sp. UFRGS-B20]